MMCRGRKTTAETANQVVFRAMPGSERMLRYWQRQAFVERRKDYVTAVTYKFSKFLCREPEKDLIHCANRAFIHDNSSGN